MQLNQKWVWAAKWAHASLARKLDGLGRKALFKNGELNWDFLAIAVPLSLLLIAYLIRQNTPL